MKNKQKIFLIFIASILFISTIAGLVGKYILAANWAFIVSLPALVISGFTAFGHIITLDDDMPGEWSNPDGNQEQWHSSLKELLLKILLFLGLYALLH